MFGNTDSELTSSISAMRWFSFTLAKMPPQTTTSLTLVRSTQYRT